LKPEYRQVLVLIYLNEFSMAETAEVMKRSVAATKVLSHRAKKSLKMILEKGGIGYEI
jgi:RNA polymerase sigma-70 factor (ECF subfamily)